MKLTESDLVIGIINHVSPDIDAEEIDNEHVHVLDSTVPELSGDLDMNGSVDSADALAMLRGSVENNVFTNSELSLCDIDGDGTITSNDALIVLRKSVGLSE